MERDDYLHYWSMMPDMPKDEFDMVLKLNVDASEMYHLYHTDNNEAFLITLTHTRHVSVVLIVMN